MRLEGQWLEQGFFDLSKREAGQSFSQEVRRELSQGLRVPTMRIAWFPTGPNFRNTLWWRDGTSDYAEAQYFARIARNHAVLSLGVSVEKGIVEFDRPPRTSQRMTGEWDWKRVVPNALTLTTELARISGQLGRSVLLSVDQGSGRVEADLVGQSVPRDRMFVTNNGKWFERHVGTATPDGILEHLKTVTQEKRRWANLYMGCELGPGEADGMTPAQVADLLMAFSPVRKRLRPR